MSRPYDPEKRAGRFPVVRLDVQYDLFREFGGRGVLFNIAASEGRAMTQRGTFEKLMPGEYYVGVRVGEVHRDRILETVPITSAVWRAAVREWEACGLIHRCGNGGDIFIPMPPSSSCLYCDLGVASHNGGLSPHATHGVVSSDTNRHEQGEPQRGTRKGNQGSKPLGSAKRSSLPSKPLEGLTRNRAPRLNEDDDAVYVNHAPSTCERCGVDMTVWRDEVIHEHLRTCGSDIIGSLIEGHKEAVLDDA
jgi:hypothetical protein